MEVSLCTDMEIGGLDNLTSPNAHKLFAVGKDWIVKLWAAAERKIAKIEVLPKLIGRNKGFILDVHVCDPCETVRYFAKIQSPHIDTVITHYLLKYTNSGPDEFFTAMLDPAFRYGWYFCEEHGVITRNISGWQMASNWTTEDEVKMISRNGVLHSFILTLLIHLGRFGNIPGNRDNWGFVDNEEAALDATRLKLVDFSAGGSSYALEDLDCFQHAWADTLLSCISPYAKHLPTNLKDSTKKLIEQHSMVECARQFPWLHSQEAFVGLLQQVCVDTESWLFDTINPPTQVSVDVGGTENEGNANGAESLGTTEVTIPAPASQETVVVAKDDGIIGPGSGESCANAHSTSTQPPPLLQAFRDKPMPNVKRCSGTKATMVGEYTQWVEQWNDEITEFCKWFPFPAAAVMDALCVMEEGKGEAVGEEGKGEINAVKVGETEDAPVQAEASQTKVEEGTRVQQESA